MTEPAQTVPNVAARKEEFTIPTAQRTKKHNVLLKKSKDPRQRRENGTKLRIVNIRLKDSAATEFNKILLVRQPCQNVKFSNVFETNRSPSSGYNGDEIICRNVGKTSRLDAAVCLRKFHCVTVKFTLQDT
jgi:hypothetical protein